MVWVDQRQLGHMSHTDVNLFHLDQHFLVEMVEDKEECCYGKVCRCWPSGVGKRTVRFPTLAPHCYTRPPARNAFSKPTAMLSLYFTLQLECNYNAIHCSQYRIPWKSHFVKFSISNVWQYKAIHSQANCCHCLVEPWWWLQDVLLPVDSAASPAWACLCQWKSHQSIKWTLAHSFNGLRLTALKSASMK